MASATSNFIGGLYFRSFSPNSNYTVAGPAFLTFPRLTQSRCETHRLSFQATRCLRRHLLAYTCLCGNGDLGLPIESDSSSSAASKEAVFDIKLPRRNLLVKFTCNSCGIRTQRIINRLAYEKGTVFVQCAGCLLNHKLVDNLGLVVEYDFRKEEGDSDSKSE